MSDRVMRFQPLLLAFLLIGAAPAAPEKAAPASIYRSDDLGLIVETQKLKLPRIDAVLKTLELKPGMTVLDIGAGSGQQSYKLAEALKGTGKVYAADIEPKLVEYVAAQAKQRGLKNLETMLVSPEGVDPAYAAHSYDVILMYDVYNYLKDRKDYYAGLRKLLKPGGRVVLVEAESVPDRSFYPEDVKDWDGLAAKLKDEPLDSPFGRNLRAPLRRLLENGARPAQEPALRRAILFHLNRTLDMKFYRNFSDGLAFKGGLDFNAEEKPYAEWLLHRLTLDGVSDRDLARTELQLYRLMEMVNKLIVIQHLRPYLAFGDVQPYWSGGLEADWYREHDRRVEELKEAGYALDRRVPLPPFQAVWIFRAAE